MPFDPGRIPDDLIKAYKEKRCASLVGAGASKGAGLPLWGELLLNMVQSALAHRVIDATKAAEYRALASQPSKYLVVAGGLKEDLGSYFETFIREQFVDPKPRPTALHDALVRADRMQFSVTTNYDTILERRYRMLDPDVPVCTYKDAGEVRSRLSRGEFFILKAHGDAAKPANGLILTDVDYRQILYRERAYQSVLASIFTMRTLLFVGASMVDPEVNLLLHYIADTFSPGSGPVHYALMAEDDVTNVERHRWFRDLNVHMIPISKADNYREIPEFLIALHDAA